MSRWAAGVEYIGTDFRGWQTHTNLRCVQSTLEAALSKVADHAVAITAAGRTDAGVHGLQQVIHFDSEARRSDYAWLLGCNTNLPQDLSLRWVQPVDGRFHARFSARARHYRYVVHNQRARSALLRERAAWWPQRLDAEAMHRSAQLLLGEQDFSAFRDSECQSPTAMRYMRHINVFRRGDFVVMDICANAFLHHMVRNIAGTLAEVGLGKQPVEWVGEVLASRQRTRAGMTAPACGLYFVGPEYPAEFALPERPEPYFPA
ncbi:MAG TPA: tRNA pseudouridine(38-40) synthase TruA [Solimonas sp.]|nr:tRNA pseudouridine(38-40) synthase TruA [Solimonas sp.]